MRESDIEDFIWSQDSELVDVTTFSEKRGTIDSGDELWRDHLVGIYGKRLNDLQERDADHGLQRKMEFLLERLGAMDGAKPLYFWVAKSESRTYTGIADHEQVIFCSSSVS